MLLALAVLLTLPAIVFILYRFCLPLLGRWQTLTAVVSTGSKTRVGLVTVSHEASTLLNDKLNQLSTLRDGMSNSATPIVAVYAGLDGAGIPVGQPWANMDVQWFAGEHRQGKNPKLAEIVNNIQVSDNPPDVLVFTDVDAQVALSSIKALLDPFRQSDVGAVTGRRRIQDTESFATGQQAYVSADDRIRALEMQHLGSVTSSDGKLYAIRTALIDPLPADVTDDLYTALGAVASGMRLVSAPDAVATIGRPAKDPLHDLVRRRRVTTRGLSTLWRRRALMNPAQTGGFGPALFMNKVLRRFAAPCLLLAILVSVLWLVLNFWSTHSALIMGLFVVCALSATVLLQHAGLRYIGLGLLGMTLGVWDFVRGKRITRWEPRKQAVAGGKNAH